MKLSTIFSKERDEIEKEISKATSLDRVTEVVRHRLEDLEKIYLGGKLTVGQVRLASSFLETLRQSTAISTTSETRGLSPEPQQAIDRVRRSPDSLILKLLQSLICIGILGSLVPLTQTAPGAWMTILLTSLLIGLEVVIQRDKDKPENSPAPPVDAPQAVLVDSKVLLDNLAEALNTIDIAVASAGEVKNPLESSGIEEFPELLNFLQRLMGASVLEKPQMMVELSRILPQILMEQGICSRIYQPDAEHSDREYFDFEPSIDRSAKEYVTINPALLKGDRLICKGRVIKPSDVRE